MSSEGHRLPSFLPDGRHFLFSVLREARLDSIRIGSLESTASAEIVAGPGADIDYTGNVTEARFVAGRVLFARGGTLLAQPFDERKLQIAGDAVPIVARIQGVDFGRYQFAATETGLLVYQPAPAFRTRQLMWLTRTGERQQAVWEPGNFDAYGAGGARRLSVSPDGRRAAVIRVDPQTDRGQVWIVDLERGAGWTLACVSVTIPLGTSRRMVECSWPFPPGRRRPCRRGWSW